MTLKQKQKTAAVTLATVVSIIAAMYIYPVFLMLINSLKPFGEVVSSAISLPKVWAPENYAFVVGKMS